MSRGGPVADDVDDPRGLKQSGARNVLLLVHGFNNNRQAADSAFDALIHNLSGAMGPGNRELDALARFQWPGDAAVGPWPAMDFLGYPVDIERAREAAARLAAFLLDMLATRGGQAPARLVIVGHSLGCRLILEAFDSLSGLGEPIRIDLLCMFAAAVPVALTEAGRRLATPPVASHRLLKCYSERDWVLRLTFPAGQTLARVMGIEPEAYLEPVGLHGNPTGFGTPRRTQNGHGDYWADTELAGVLAAEIDPTLRSPPPPATLATHALHEVALPTYSAPERSLPA
ncbi:MAG: DUF726 domain-containing protein [Alphaproteobacteria bacterium]|nr:DUF726 domain-containing protein [Alphaproteobacteria bacterium]